jgi:hypothetical protein
MQIKLRMAMLMYYPLAKDKAEELLPSLQVALDMGYTHVCIHCGKYYHDEQEYFTEEYCSMECEDAYIEAEYQACLALDLEGEDY